MSEDTPKIDSLASAESKIHESPDYMKGYNAFNADKVLNDNPEQINTKAYKQWEIGFYDSWAEHQKTVN